MKQLLALGSCVWDCKLNSLHGLKTVKMNKGFLLFSRHFFPYYVRKRMSDLITNKFTVELNSSNFNSEYFRLRSAAFLLKLVLPLAMYCRFNANLILMHNNVHKSFADTLAATATD
jgi:hypothetical protein